MKAFLENGALNQVHKNISFSRHEVLWGLLHFSSDFNFAFKNVDVFRTLIHIHVNVHQNAVQ